MVTKHVRRLKYRLKGLLQDIRAGRPKLKTSGTATTHYHKAQISKKIQASAPRDTVPDHRGRKIAPVQQERRSIVRPQPQPLSPKEKDLSGMPYSSGKYYGQSFHPYRKEPMLQKISRLLGEKGLPPLPLLFLVVIVIIGAILPLTSVSFLYLEPREIDLSIAVQALDGNVLKDATVYLLTPDLSEIKYSEKTGPDGTASFRSLPVNQRFVIVVEKDGRRISIEERELRVPFPKGRKDIVIVKRAVS